MPPFVLSQPVLLRHNRQRMKPPDGTYKIADSKSGKVLTAVRPEHEATARIVTEEWREQDEQKWELIPIDLKDLTM